MKFLSALAIAALTTGVATSASALTKSCTFNMEVSFFLETSSDVKCETGNDTNTIDSDYVMFGKSGWVLQDKTDEEKDGNLEIDITQGVINRNIDSIDFNWGGTWDVSGSGMPQHIVITLKQATGFAAFLLTSNGVPQEGMWGTDGGSLSHASVYTVGVVPLPASSLLLLGVVGAGGIAAWRKKRQAA